MATSQGAIFQLVLRDDRFDKVFTASHLLHKRLSALGPAASARDISATHINYVESVYQPWVAIASEYARVRPSGGGTVLGAAGGTCEFTFPTFGHFTSDMVFHVRFRPLGSPSASRATPETPYWRWCALPGARLFSRVQFKSAAVVLDEYTSDDIVMDSKFFISQDRRTGWERCQGQQEAREATYFANGCTASFIYRDGPQTPRLYQEGFDIFSPVAFWHCRDPSTALPNALLPSTQRTIVCDLAPLNEILAAYIQTDDDPGSLLQIPLPFDTLAVDISLYVNNLYVSPEVHDILARQTSFALTRVRRRVTRTLDSPTGAFLLDKFKFPAEYLMVGFRARSLAADFDRWWMMGEPRTRTNGTKLLAPAVVWDPVHGMCSIVCRQASEASALDSIVDSLSITAHGIELYSNYPAAFYNAYLPGRYNGPSYSPVDPGAYLIPLCLFAGQKNPSGYYNLSAGRELYLRWTLVPDTVFLPDKYELLVTMSALNFIVRKGDSVVLRYSL